MNAERGKAPCVRMSFVDWAGAQTSRQSGDEVHGSKHVWVHDGRLRVQAREEAAEE